MEKELWQHLKETKKPIVIYGMGNGADKIIDVLESYGVKISGVFATDSFVRDKIFRGFRMTTYSSLKEKFGDMIILMSFGSSRDEVFNTIKKLSDEQEFYAPDVPVYGDGLFNNQFYNDNREEILKIYNSLADDISKETFEDVINYKLSGKIEYLTKCQVQSIEPYQSFLKLQDNENFVDLGAYNGDTVAEFLKNVSDYQSITAVEPDIKTFKKLEKNTENVKNLRLVNACISDYNGKKAFAMKGGRNSVVAQDGTLIDCMTVDTILNGNKASYVKFDVEGEEVRAINGMKNTIQKYNPKMLISCYHRTDDLISIPNAINKIQDGYKIYLRHFKYVPAWDTNYYFIK